MKELKLYHVTCERHINCQIRKLSFLCFAYNATQAEKNARESWAALDVKSHLFAIYAARSHTKIDALCVRAWNGTEYRGEDAIGKFICTDFRTWRVNGRNLYEA